MEGCAKEQKAYDKGLSVHIVGVLHKAQYIILYIMRISYMNFTQPELARFIFFYLT